MENLKNKEKISSSSNFPKRKKYLLGLLIGGISFLGIFLLFGLSLFMGIPKEKIKSLREGHVKVAVKGPDINEKYKAEYHFQKKKPEDWVNLEEMSETAIHAIVVSEDWAFYNHKGYDVSQIEEATKDALEGERVRGASTITQQLAKNLFLSPEKSLMRKMKELGISMYLEGTVKKNKILETYLNVIEYGPGIYGIKKAAKHYFNKEPKDLNPKEGAFLAMLLPNPKKNARSFEEKKLTKFATHSINKIIEKMAKAKYIPKEEVKKYQEKLFTWEDKSSLTKEEIMLLNKKKKNKEKPRRKRIGELDGAELERRLRQDPTLDLDENPEFDEDALTEEISGIEGEFSLE